MCVDYDNSCTILQFTAITCTNLLLFSFLLFSSPELKVPTYFCFLSVLFVICISFFWYERVYLFLCYNWCLWDNILWTVMHVLDCLPVSFCWLELMFAWQTVLFYIVFVISTFVNHVHFMADSTTLKSKTFTCWKRDTTYVNLSLENINNWYLYFVYPNTELVLDSTQPSFKNIHLSICTGTFYIWLTESFLNAASITLWIELSKITNLY